MQMFIPTELWINIARFLPPMDKFSVLNLRRDLRFPLKYNPIMHQIDRNEVLCNNTILGLYVHLLALIPSDEPAYRRDLKPIIMKILESKNIRLRQLLLKIPRNLWEYPGPLIMLQALQRKDIGCVSFMAEHNMITFHDEFIKIISEEPYPHSLPLQYISMIIINNKY